ncbi:MAG: LysR family transcriptional regulator [Firmicutes bacterium]|nr:LysR family transcriptional regulator [Bacillota bacterium]
MISTLQLQYFCALAHKQNLTKCAEDFYISQSTLSNALARMEADLEVRLFDRVGRSLILNNYEKIYLQYAEAALKALENGKRAVANELNEQKNKVIVYTISPLLFSGTIDRFAWEHPEFDIIQREFLFSDISSIDSYDPFISIILAGTSDIRNANWSAHEFRRDTLCALLTKTHPLSNSSSIAFEELKQHPLILEENRTSFRAYVDKTFEAYGCTPIVAGESNYSLLAENLKRKPHAIGLTTSLTAENKWYEKVYYLSLISVAGMDADRGFSLFWQKDAPLSDAAVAFIEYIKETKAI